MRVHILWVFAVAAIVGAAGFFGGRSFSPSSAAQSGYVDAARKSSPPPREKALALMQNWLGEEDVVSLRRRCPRSAFGACVEFRLLRQIAALGYPVRQGRRGDDDYLSATWPLKRASFFRSESENAFVLTLGKYKKIDIVAMQEGERGSTCDWKAQAKVWYSEMTPVAHALLAETKLEYLQKDLCFRHAREGLALVRKSWSQGS